MSRSPERQAQLSRMEEARRQIQRQLDMIDRQITRRMTALIPHAAAPHFLQARKAARSQCVP